MEVHKDVLPVVVLLTSVVLVPLLLHFLSIPHLFPEDFLGHRESR